MTRTKKASVDIYFRFLQLANAVRGLPSLGALDPREERLLEIIACAWQRREPLSVGDVIHQSELGSPAMLHKRLHTLRKKGWILLEETEDRRRKQLDLTPSALSYFGKLAQCMQEATGKR